MALLKTSDRDTLRQEFQKMTQRVRLLFFTQALGCETCSLTGQILDEIAPLSDQLEVVKHNFAIDREQVAQYGIVRIPAIVVLRVEETAEPDNSSPARTLDYGIRFYGVPSGYEFMSLIGAVLDVAAGDSGLSPASRALVAQITAPTHLQVFTTPT